MSHRKKAGAQVALLHKIPTKKLSTKRQMIRTHPPLGGPGSDHFHLVPVTGLEPVRHRWRWILSPLRLPFHHTGIGDLPV